MLNTISAESFESLIGQSFSVATDAGDILLELIEVSKNEGAATVNEARQSFSIIFRSDKEQALEQGMFDFSHDELKLDSLFIVPIGPDETGMCYECIFN